MSELRTKADAINRAGAAMQAAIDVTDDPTGDYDIAISAAAPAAVEVLWPEIERLRQVIAETSAELVGENEPLAAHLDRALAAAPAAERR